MSPSPLAKPQLSRRIVQNIKDAAPMEKFMAILANQYDPETNPDGIAVLGIAENALMYKELTEFINKKLTVDSFMCSYGTGPSGSIALRTALAGLMNRYFAPVVPVKAKQIVVSSGCTTILEMLAWVLTDPEDGILIGRPFYSAFPGDFRSRAKAKVVPVAFEGSDPFVEGCVKYYEHALENFNQEAQVAGHGKKVRALVICNPHNPLGQCFSRETLIALMRLCQKHQIHLVSDEIYALSHWENPEAAGAPTFTSVLSIDLEGIIEPELVHVLYGMSKDFSANGFRMGAFISQHNAEAVKGMSAIGPFGWPSGLADRAWTEILKDTEFMEMWIEKNTQRLGDNFRWATALLKEWGIKYHTKGNAALFLWLDLSDYLPLGSHGDEAEMDLARRLIEGGVFISPGTAFAAETLGSFRLVFSMSWDLVELGLRRMMKVLKQ